MRFNQYLHLLNRCSSSPRSEPPPKVRSSRQRTVTSAAAHVAKGRPPRLRSSRHIRRSGALRRRRPSRQDPVQCARRRRRRASLCITVHITIITSRDDLRGILSRDLSSLRGIASRDAVFGTAVRTTFRRAPRGPDREPVRPRAVPAPKSARQNLRAKICAPKSRAADRSRRPSSPRAGPGRAGPRPRHEMFPHPFLVLEPTRL